MKASVKYGLLGALAAFFIDILLFVFGWNEIDRVVLYTVFFNILLLLLAIFFGLRKESATVENPPGSFGLNFRIGMQANLVFTVSLALFTLVYYKYVDSDYLQKKIDKRVEQAEAYDISKHDFKDSAVEPMTQEEFVANEKAFAERIYTPFFHSTMKMVGLTVMGVVYCLFFAFLRSRNRI
ncbi:MAG: DUF4199 family protein [Flavobacteriales bacterium]|nr:DUF4199 family protein [Flavobacteriales bacterium]